MKKTTIQKHEKEYIHIPKPAILPLIGMIVFGLLAYSNLYVIDYDVISEAFTCEEDACNLQTPDLIIIYPIVGEYILVNLLIISFVAFFKGGYKNLKNYKEGGLIGGLIVGLIGGLIGGLIWGLIGGLIVGLIGGLIWGLIGGLIGGLIVGLIGGLIWGLIGGLIKEFS